MRLDYRLLDRSCLRNLNLSQLELLFKLIEIETLLLLLIETPILTLNYLDELLLA